LTLLITWVLFPLVLTALAVGCGLLVERIAGIRLPGALVPVTGLALIIVVAQFLTLSEATAELATPAAVSLAVVGFGLALPLRGRPIDWWAVGVVVAVFAVYAAPIVLSGEATFAGYIQLDDTATWMTLTDRVMEHGRSLAGLAPSTYEATLDFNLASGYPVGVFLPLGIGRALVGQDVAWVIQPYMAWLAALLTLGLWGAAGSLVRPRALRAIACFLAAQSALLFGYYLWGGIKEIAAAALIASAAALAVFAAEQRLAWPILIPLSLLSAALIGVLTTGGAIWLAPMLLAILIVGWRMLGGGETLRRAVAFVAATAVLSIPVIGPGGLLPPTSSPLTSETALGNLFRPLSVVRLFGVWPSGDFRADPTDPATAHVLIAVVGGAAILGLVLAVRARAWALLVYGLGTLVAGLVLFAIGSPWVGGKALASASPAIPLLAAAGAAALYAAGRRVEGAVLLVAVAAGVIWSSALAYRDVNLAPRDQLAELETIGHMIEQEGPTLMTEYQPYGVRHFLRDADPEGASELRRRQVSLVGGGTLHKGETADTDRFALSALTVYRTLVLRRGPGQSRPPSPYQLTWQGHYYDVWQRPVGIPKSVLEHLGLGTDVDPAGVPRCSDVLRLAREAGSRGRLAAVPRAPVVAFSIQDLPHPSAWDSPDYPSSLLPTTPGSIQAKATISQPGPYQVWLGGSERPEVDLLVDGQPVDSVRGQLNNAGEYVLLGQPYLGRGAHVITIRFHGADLHPGSGGAPAPIGPMVLTSQDAANTRISYFEPSQAKQLCGKRWDWVEALAG